MLQKIKCLELECEDLEKQKEKIRLDIQEANVSIETELNMGIDYSRDRVQTSSSCGRYAEEEMIKEIERLEREWIFVRRRLLKRRAKIRELERKINPLRNNIQMLSEENKSFIEYKYGDKPKPKSVDS